jgi:transaldolase
VGAVAKTRELGQSLWLDFIRRDWLTGGKLKRMIEEGTVTGLTSNPTIFERGILESPEYDPSLRQLLAQDPRRDAQSIFEALAMEDIRGAADLLRPVFDRTEGGDGYASLEVSPRLAKDTDGTVSEARRLFRAVGRPNLMIKVPATREGLPAIAQLLSEGIHVNVTLMFSQQDYADVVESYLAGLERRARDGAPLDRVSSVASFFVSRIDSQVDPLLPEGSPLRGKIAVDNAKLAYDQFRKILSSRRFQTLQQKGARPQRVLWGSTGTKNPKYSDVLYVEELIGPHTVNTLPPETLEAFRDHGIARLSITEGLAEARRRIDELPSHGVDLDGITRRLKEEGVQAFSKSFDALLASLKKKQDELQKASKRTGA